MRSSTNLLIYWSVETVHSYSGGTNRPGEPCYNFSISKDRTQILFFLLRSMAVTLAVLLFWTLVFVLLWLSLHWKVLIMLVSQFPLIFVQTQCGDVGRGSVLLFIAQLLIETVFVIIWEMFCWKISLNLVLLRLLLLPNLLANPCCNWCICLKCK